MRFVLDHDVSVKVRAVIRDAGHQCWTAGQAGLDAASDSELAVYAHDKNAVLVSHDRDFAQKRKENTYGQHV